MAPTEKIVLFGYDSSPFTQKVRLALKLRQIPYTFVLVPSMMPRPVLLDHFNLTYRKIPVLAINRDLYIDTSLILEAIHLHPSYTPCAAHPPLHPDAQTRTLTRLLSSHYTDRPLFRLTTGLIPHTVWESPFGADRSALIGHTLDAGKLKVKVPRNLSALDTYLSIVEPLFARNHGLTWFLGTAEPCGADISLYYQLKWGELISRGEGVNDLTGGNAPDGQGEGMRSVFNTHRYPGLMTWYERFEKYLENLPNLETRIERHDNAAVQEVIRQLNEAAPDKGVSILSTPVPEHGELDERIGLHVGGRVSIAPDDTGRDDPTVGTLVGLSTEEVIIKPDEVDGRKPTVQDVRMHFPRVGFVIKPIATNKTVEFGATKVRVKAKL